MSYYYLKNVEFEWGGISFTCWSSLGSGEKNYLKILINEKMFWSLNFN